MPRQVLVISLAADHGGVVLPTGEHNAAMIGSQGYYEYLAGHTAGWELNARAGLDIGKG